MRGWVLILSLGWILSAHAGQCHGKILNPLTDVCWSCLFPLTIGQVNVVKSKVPDLPNPKNPICECTTGNVPKVGLAVGFWEPARVVEVVREPYCFPILGGLDFGGRVNSQGSVSEGQRGLYHVHYFVYPLLYWMNVLTDGLCVEQADFDIGYLSELDPTWRYEALAFAVHPEAALFNNPVAIAACSEDCALSEVKVSDKKLFWCAGCQGSLFPITGYVQHQHSGVQGSLLLTQRLLYKLHHQGVLWRGAGEDVLCRKKPQLIMDKSQYRTQMVYPVAETRKNLGGCMPMGRSSVTWEANKQFPIKGEDYAYLIWRKNNCCAF